jgi:hypothetical protein
MIREKRFASLYKTSEIGQETIDFVYRGGG